MEQYKIHTYLSFIDKDGKHHSLSCTVCKDGIQTSSDGGKVEIINPARVAAFENTLLIRQSDGLITNLKMINPILIEYEDGYGYKLKT